MSKFSLRIAISFLIPCLIIDQGLAASFRPMSFYSHQPIASSLSDRMQLDTLNFRSGVFFRSRGLNRYKTIELSKNMGDISLAVQSSHRSLFPSLFLLGTVFFALTIGAGILPAQEMVQTKFPLNSFDTIKHLHSWIVSLLPALFAVSIVAGVYFTGRSDARDEQLSIRQKAASEFIERHREEKEKGSPYDLHHGFLGRLTAELAQAGHISEADVLANAALARARELFLEPEDVGALAMALVHLGRMEDLADLCRYVAEKYRQRDAAQALYQAAGSLITSGRELLLIEVLLNQIDALTMSSPEESLATQLDVADLVRQIGRHAEAEKRVNNVTTALEQASLELGARSRILTQLAVQHLRLGHPRDQVDRLIEQAAAAGQKSRGSHRTGAFEDLYALYVERGARQPAAELLDSLMRASLSNSRRFDLMGRYLSFYAEQSDLDRLLSIVQKTKQPRGMMVGPAISGESRWAMVAGMARRGVDNQYFDSNNLFLVFRALGREINHLGVTNGNEAARQAAHTAMEWIRDIRMPTAAMAALIGLSEALPEARAGIADALKYRSYYTPGDDRPQQPSAAPQTGEVVPATVETPVSLTVLSMNGAINDNQRVFFQFPTSAEVAIPPQQEALRDRYFFSTAELFRQSHLHPLWGYYSRGKVAFREDFWTLPYSLTPYFGQMHAEQIFKWWKEMRASGELGADEPFDLIEVAGAKGRLSRDILNWIEQHCESSELNHQEWREMFAQLRLFVGDPSGHVGEEILEQSRLGRVLAASGRLQLRRQDATEFLAGLGKGHKGLVFSNEFFDATPPFELRLSPDGRLEATLVMPIVEQSMIKDLQTRFGSFQEPVWPLDGQPWIGISKTDYLRLRQALERVPTDRRDQFRKALRVASVHVPAQEFPDIQADLRLIEGSLQTAAATLKQHATILIFPGHTTLMRSMGDVLASGFVLVLDYMASTRTLLRSRREQWFFYRSHPDKVHPLVDLGDMDITGRPNASVLIRAADMAGLILLEYTRQIWLKKGTPINWVSQTLMQLEGTSLLKSSVYKLLLFRKDARPYHRLTVGAA